MVKISFSESNRDGLRAFHSPEFTSEFFSCLADGPTSIVITSHKNADLDSLGSIVGLAELLAIKMPEKRITIVLQSMNTMTKKLAQLLEITVPKDIDEIDGPVTAILLDCNNPQITGFKDLFSSDSFSQRLIIDHHAKHAAGSLFADKYWLESEFGATSEIIVVLAAQWGIGLRPTTASALLGGILYDSQRFTRADAPLFQTVRLLLHWGADYNTVQVLFRSEMDRSEKLARLKAAQRIQLEIVHNGIVAMTHVSSFEASAARALLNLGADLAVVIASRSTETRASIRARKEYLDQLGISVGEDLLDPIATEFGGVGGGHHGAGGLNIPQQVSPPEIYRLVLNRLQASVLHRKEDQ